MAIIFETGVKSVHLLENWKLYLDWNSFKKCNLIEACVNKQYMLI